MLFYQFVLYWLVRKWLFFTRISGCWALVGIHLQILVEVVNTFLACMPLTRIALMVGSECVVDFFPRLFLLKYSFGNRLWQSIFFKDVSLVFFLKILLHDISYFWSGWVALPGSSVLFISIVFGHKFLLILHRRLKLVNRIHRVFWMLRTDRQISWLLRSIFETNIKFLESFEVRILMS